MVLPTVESPNVFALRARTHRLGTGCQTPSLSWNTNVPEAHATPAPTLFGRMPGGPSGSPAGRYGNLAVGTGAMPAGATFSPICAGMLIPRKLFDAFFATVTKAASRPPGVPPGPVASAWTCPWVVLVATNLKVNMVRMRTSTVVVPFARNATV